MQNVGNNHKPTSPQNLFLHNNPNLSSNTSLSMSGCTKKKSQAKQAILKQVKENSKVTKNTSFAECYVHLFSINMNGINDFELYEAYLISVLFHLDLQQLTHNPTAVCTIIVCLFQHNFTNNIQKASYPKQASPVALDHQLAKQPFTTAKKNLILQGWWADRFILYPHSYA